MERPSYAAIFLFVPGLIALINGKKRCCKKHWLMNRILGFAAVYWNGQGGPRAFRRNKPHTQARAEWTYTSDIDASCIPNVDVYEDPEFSETSRTQSVYTFPRDILAKGDDAVERLLPPKEYARRLGKSMGLRYSCSIDHEARPQADGRWWPIWLVGRTKTGWWTICWYQVLDGTWIIVFWWYADVHVHLLDVQY